MDGKSVIIFLAGASVGAVGTWFGIKGYYEAKFKKELDERWDDIRRQNEKYLKIVEETIDEKPEEEPVRVSHLGNNEDLNLLRKRTADYKSLATNYGSFYNDIPPANPESNEVEKTIVPYEIDAEEAGYGLDLNTVSYYTEDDILVDDLSEEELSIEDSIGMLGRQLRLDSDEEAVYIRNEKLGLDYEVLKINDSYERVMGEKNELSDA